MSKDSKFDFIFKLAARGFCRINTSNSQISQVNQRFCDIFGVNKDDLTATTFMEKTHPDDLQAYLDNMQKLLAGDLREFSSESRYIHCDGSIVWCNVTVAALWNVGEEPGDHIAIVEDISKRKRAEEHLQATNSLLDKRVAERTAELQSKAQELEEINVALKVLLQKQSEVRAEIGEDLLGTINIAVKPLLQKLAAICPDKKQQKFIAMIEAHLSEVIKPFPRVLAARNLCLSKTETTVADLVKNGLSNKEVAKHLNISLETVAFHRKNIRKKLGLTNKGTPLVTYLQNLMQG